MSWANDLASGLGIPAGAAALAVAMYAGCSAAEKAARPEALRDIGRILKDPSWSRSVRPSAIIERMFVWTFGEQHLSWRCALASAQATFVFGSGFAAIITLATKKPIYGHPFREIFYHPGQVVPTWTILALVTFVPDYIALWKTRLLTRTSMADNSTTDGVLLVVFDVLFSGAISFATAYTLYVVTVKTSAYMVLHYWHQSDNFWINQVLNVIFSRNEANSTISNYQFVQSVPGVSKLVVGSVLEPFGGNSPVLSPFTVTFWSTMMTSTWTILILLSTTVLKLLAPLHRFTAWFFDVEKHPVQAIGIVAGALVMIGSLVWSIVRAVI